MKDIEIPFGAFDSELQGFTYTIPEGYTAEIKDDKVFIKKGNSSDKIYKSMTIEEIAHNWAISNEDTFPVNLKYIEFFYHKGLRKGLILAKQEIQKRIINTEDDTVLMELQKIVKSIDALLTPSLAPKQLI